MAPAILVAGGVEEGGRLWLRAYGEGGLVGGSNPTAFVEGQAVTAIQVASFDIPKTEGKERSEAALEAGIGLWGGAQRGAARVDAGPSISLRLPIGEALSRVQLDYRFRVAGQSEPGSGPALTLSTGF